jgi:tRNA G10  N-methylase Trm11
MTNKMDLYCATFVSGGQQIIERQLKKKPVNRFKIVEVLDGMVVFETDYTPHELRQMRFLTNIFVILNGLYFKEDMSFENLFKRFINDGVHNKSHIKTLLGKHRETFKIVVSENNQTIGFDRVYLQKAETVVEKDLGMELSVREPQRELWFMRRNKIRVDKSEAEEENDEEWNTAVTKAAADKAKADSKGSKDKKGNTKSKDEPSKNESGNNELASLGEILEPKNKNIRLICALRLTQLSEDKKHHRAGELPPEIAELLILESNPTPKDIILDPFCGYGGILKERVHFNAYRKAIGIDSHERAIEGIHKELNRQINTRKNIQLIFGDFFDQGENIIPKASITKIITDPPWTSFRGKSVFKDHAFENNQIDYQEMLKKFEFVLMKGGKAVILIVGDKEEFENILFNFQKTLKLDRTSHILVSGKKAGIYTISRQ